jgi:hypothetical protein
MIMRNGLCRRPQVESLESIPLLSGASTALQGAAAIVATVIPGHETDLNGTARGTYHVHIANPDTGKIYKFSGSGNITPLGHVGLTGNVQTLGFIAQGNASGQLFLSNSRGTLTLTLTGPVQNGLAPIPDHFAYSITNASGRFLGATGSGVVALGLHPGKTSPTAEPDLPTEHGHFTMIFISLPSPKAGSGTTTT